jgi:hypothetical protein
MVYTMTKCTGYTMLFFFLYFHHNTPCYKDVRSAVVFRGPFGISVFPRYLVMGMNDFRLKLLWIESFCELFIFIMYCMT